MRKEEGEGADDTGRKDRKGLGKRNDMDILEGEFMGESKCSIIFTTNI